MKRAHKLHLNCKSITLSKRRKNTKWVWQRHPTCTTYCHAERHQGGLFLLGAFKPYPKPWPHTGSNATVPNGSSLTLKDIKAQWGEEGNTLRQPACSVIAAKCMSFVGLWKHNSPRNPRVIWCCGRQRSSQLHPIVPRPRVKGQGPQRIMLSPEKKWRGLGGTTNRCPVTCLLKPIL